MSTPGNEPLAAAEAHMSMHEYLRDEGEGAPLASEKSGLRHAKKKAGLEVGGRRCTDAGVAFHDGSRSWRKRGHGQLGNSANASFFGSASIGQ